MESSMTTHCRTIQYSAVHCGTAQCSTRATMQFGMPLHLWQSVEKGVQHSMMDRTMWSILQRGMHIHDICHGHGPGSTEQKLYQGGPILALGTSRRSSAHRSSIYTPTHPHPKAWTTRRKSPGETPLHNGLSAAGA